MENVKSKCRELIDNLRVVFKDEIFYEDAYIAGGCIRSMILDEHIKDVDIFLKSSRAISYLKGLKLGFESANAITFYLDGMRYQIIINTTGLPKEVIGEFDFTVNMSSYDYITDELYIESEEDIKAKQLTFNPKCRNKIGSLGRLTKFVNRGYKIPDRLNILQIGVDLTECSPISTFEELEIQSRFHFSEDDFNQIDFVDKPKDNPELIGGYLPLGVQFIEKGYTKTLSYKAKHRGSGL